MPKRKSAAQRGLDQDWKRLRVRKLAANPICEFRGCQSKASHVDHIKRYKDKNDPLRLAWSNLQSLCAHHHNSWKQKVECKLYGPRSRRTRKVRIGKDGYPIVRKL